MDDDTTTKDDQYLTDVLSYSVDRLAKVRFSFLLLFRSFLLLRYRYRLHRSLSFSISTIDLQIQSGFGDVKASSEETRAFDFDDDDIDDENAFALERRIRILILKFWETTGTGTFAPGTVTLGKEAKRCGDKTVPSVYRRAFRVRRGPGSSGKSEGGFILGRGRVTGAEEIVQRLCEPSGKRGESESGESTAFKSRTRGHIGYFRDSANARAMREERRVRRGVGFRAVRGTVESEFTGRSGD